MTIGLKNAGATYQRAATTLLHNLIYKEVEVYVDDMIVKSKDCEGHISALRKFFERTFLKLVCALHVLWTSLSCHQLKPLLLC